MIALREAWGRLVLCNTASKMSGLVPKQTVLWSCCLCRSREGGGWGMLAPFCFLTDGTKISKCQVSGSLLLPQIWGEGFVTCSLWVRSGRQLGRERGWRRAQLGRLGSWVLGGMSVYRSHLSQESCGRSALSTSGSVLNVIERQLKWRWPFQGELDCLPRVVRGSDNASLRKLSSLLQRERDRESKLAASTI